VKRWISGAGKHGESPKVEAFLAEVVEVCKRHGLALSHEDGHGAFEVVDLAAGDLDWLMDAFDSTEQNGKAA
jgi:hypothetical protein